MNNIQEQLRNAGIEVPEILLPQGANLRQWAVIACDQFTQDRDYWKRAGEAAAGSPSALHVIFPEVYLDDGNRAGRIAAIHETMRSYLDSGVFAPPQFGCMYIERDTPFNRGRRGLVAAVDLEQYSWQPSGRLLIRATEGTVEERLPPRMDIRRNAPVETPHILLLIDDETDTLLKRLGERAQKKTPAYRGDLMLDSGSVSGWLLNSEDDLAFLAAGLDDLARRSVTRYASEDKFLFAVGDGNHSLASAKGIWEEYKAASPIPDLRHPSRYALVEIENIYDPAITFEPIHRVAFGMSFDHALKLLSALPGFTSRNISGREELVRLTTERVQGTRFGIIAPACQTGQSATASSRFALVETSAGGVSTISLQPILDSAGFLIDYIHGKDELFRLASIPDKPATGFLLPPVHKDGFFETIARSGPLPQKSFSMGEAPEKRFYIEARSLFTNQILTRP
ncbi:MAG: DUF1015 domain-containing protein [Treponema sp.]|nr:DUF1015 domain-containing protein [Treponema sp.]